MPRKKKQKPYELTKEDLLALSCFTETLLVPEFDDVLNYINTEMGLDIYTHGLVFEETWAAIKQRVRPRIITIIESVYGDGSMDKVKQMAEEDAKAEEQERGDATLRT